MSEPERRIRVAIHGAGWVSTQHLAAYLAHPGVEVVAIGSRTTEGARRLAQTRGLDVSVHDDLATMLEREKVDAVSLCTPPGLHADDTVTAARAGVHALIEKPVALTVPDLLRMDREVKAAGIRTVVSFVLRWNPAVRNVKALQGLGLLGETFLVQADYWHNLVEAGLASKSDGNDVILTGGCHAVDAARFILDDDEVVSASAAGWSVDGSRATDTVATLRFRSGAMAKVSACTSQWMPYNFNLDVFGTRGAVRGDQFFTDALPGQTGMGRIPTVLPDDGDVAHHPFTEEIAHFIDCVRTGQESPVSLANSVNTHLTCFAAAESRDSGGAPVSVDSLLARHS